MTICVVEGLIGAGKSTFCQKLSTIIDNCMVLREPDEQDGNPYLQDYYKDPHKWAFTMQMHLLHERWRLYQIAKNQSELGFTVVMDRFIWGDFSFARTVHQLGIMSDREFDTYRKCYSNIIGLVEHPTVLIYLKVNPHIAFQRIKQRMRETPTRECENTVDLSYLQQLHKCVDHVMMSSHTLYGDVMGFYDLMWNEQHPSDKTWNTVMSDVMEVINYYKLEKPI